MMELADDGGLQMLDIKLTMPSTMGMHFSVLSEEKFVFVFPRDVIS